MSPDSPFMLDWLVSHAERNPEAPAISTPEVRLGYSDLATRVFDLAGQLVAAGVGSGERVVVALPNTPTTVVASLAIQAAGAVPLEVNREWSTEVLLGIVAQSRVRHAFVHARDARNWARIAESHALERLWYVHGSAGLAGGAGPVPRTLILEDGRVDPALGRAPQVRRRPPSADAPAVVLFTSGSTGRPRGVVQTYRNIDANSRSIVEYLGLGAGDRALVILPLHYCYGRSVLQTHLLAGGSVFLENRFAFPRVAMEALAAEGCTSFAGVPLTFEILRREVDVRAFAFPRLRYLTQAGGAMAADTMDWVRTSFAPAKLFVMYGQTEATARLAYLPPERASEKRGSIGVAIPGVELRVVDDGGAELPAGEPGHLVARGRNVTPGYLDDPEETAAILRDGWLWTGDLAARDEDGFFFIKGRSKEILKIGGRRVSPTEIEHVLESHPGVAESAVVGVPDALLGEVPVAFLVPRTEPPPSGDALKAHCRARMPAYQVPVRFAFLRALPRNSAGKLLRRELPAQGATA